MPIITTTTGNIGNKDHTISVPEDTHYCYLHLGLHVNEEAAEVISANFKIGLRIHDGRHYPRLTITIPKDHVIIDISNRTKCSLKN